MRRGTNISAFISSIVMVLVFGPSVSAGETPNRATGFHPEGVYDFLGLDAINAFNGNLTITVPLGITYPVAERLAYRFNLVYNANGWDYVQDRRTMWNDVTNSCEDPIGASFSNCKQRNYAYTKPTKLSNAGFGWSVSLGRVVGLPSGNSAYEAPDGSRHEFFPQLGSIPGQDSQISYTVDGSYLRANGNKVEFPDGAVHTFEGPWDNQWLELTRMEDRWGNWVTISRNLGNPYYPYNSAWLIQDIHGRQQRIYFKPEPDYYGEVIDRIHLEGFGGAPGGDSAQGAEPADGVYQFSYQSITLARHCIVEGPDYDTQAIWDPLVAKNMQVPVLTGVTLPDGTAFTISASDYNVGTTDQCPTATSGTLKKLTLPTGGRIEWDWQMQEFPTESGDNIHFTLSDYVFARRLVDANGVTRGTWNYSNTGSSADDWITTIVRPDSTSEKQYFSLHTQWTPYWGEYGLPFSRRARPENKYTGSNLFISRVLLAAGQTDPARGEQLDFVFYEGHGDIENGYRKVVTDAPRQVVRSRSDYRQSDGTYVYRGQTSSEFDGYGHYRTSITEGNFESGNVRQTTRRWNAGRGTYGSFFFQPRLASEDWLLETWDFEESIEGSSVTRREFAFGADGALSARRTYAGASRGAGDVIVKLQRDAQGQVIGERHYGGEGMALNTDYTVSYPSFPYPPCAEYRLSNTYSSGVLATSTWYSRTDGTACDNAAPLPFLTLDRSIDPTTGLISVERDSAGLASVFTYDAMGRLRSSQSPSGVRTNYDYYRVGSTSHIGISTLGYSGASVLGSDLEYDAFGRIVERKTRGANGAWSTRQTVYDDKGRRIKESEEELTPTHFTVFSNFDAFDRPRLITAPDGSTTSLWYSGTSRSTRTRSYESPAGTESATVQEVYDAAGRLIRLIDADGTVTTYGYDVESRLAGVSTSASGATQNRSFVYDGRGFLTGESHPETAAITYGSHDSLGNVRTKRYPTATPYDLNYFYDGAGRVEKIDSRNPYYIDQFRISKRYVYATENGTDPLANVFSYRKGKLESSTRHNYLPSVGDIGIKETFIYDSDGRVSTKVTTAGSFDNPTWDPEVLTDWQRFIEGYSYNEVGARTQTRLPGCILYGCASAPASNVLDYWYSPSNAWKLQSISGMVSSIAYLPNGMYQTIDHANGARDAQTIDPSTAMARPSEITVTSEAICTATVPADRWKGQYFNNKNLSGTPAMVRDDGNGSLNFNWGSGGPNVCTVGIDQFSVRWTRTVSFTAGTYRFTTATDDGVRLYVDGVLKIDKWIDQGTTTWTADVTLTAGNHTIVMEYYENGGGAYASLSWAAVASPCTASVVSDRWKGEYFANTTLSGTPAMVRDDGAADLNFDWGVGGPSSACGIPIDNFSARWTRSVSFTAGTYRFTTTTDDGVRLYVDGALKIDKWIPQAPTSYTADVTLTAGSHTIVMEYYEAAGGAVAKLSWQPITVTPVDGSTFVSQSVPSSMVAGQTYTVSVTLNNSGTSTWVTNDFRLGSMNPQDNLTWGLNRVNIPSGTSVPPGANHTFTFNVTAPTTGGSYNFQWLMIHEWVAWFGAYTPNLIINVGGVVDGSTFVSQSVPSSMVAGQTYTVSVTLNNSGTSTWVTDEFRLGSMMPQDNTRWGLNRVNVPAGTSVAPGANHTFTFNVTAPSTAGTYDFQWLMIHEWVAWFGAYTPNLSINVGGVVDGSTFVSQSVPTTMTRGQTYSVSVTLNNSGSSTWITDDFRLGSMNPQDNMTWGLNRVNVPAGAGVAPGANHTFAFNVTAPSTAGTYNFQWLMIHEWVAWFGAYTPNLSVNVQ